MSIVWRQCSEEGKTKKGSVYDRCCNPLDVPPEVIHTLSGADELRWSEHAIKMLESVKG